MSDDKQRWQHARVMRVYGVHCYIKLLVVFSRLMKSTPSKPRVLVASMPRTEKPNTILNNLFLISYRACCVWPRGVLASVGGINKNPCNSPCRSWYQRAQYKADTCLLIGCPKNTYETATAHPCTYTLYTTSVFLIYKVLLTRCCVFELLIVLVCECIYIQLYSLPQR